MQILSNYYIYWQLCIMATQELFYTCMHFIKTGQLTALKDYQGTSSLMSGDSALKLIEVAMW